MVSVEYIDERICHRIEIWMSKCLPNVFTRIFQRIHLPDKKKRFSGRLYSNLKQISEFFRYFYLKNGKNFLMKMNK